MSQTVTKKELAYRIAGVSGHKKVIVRKIIQQFIEDIIGELSRGNRLEFREFGVFELKRRAPRRARNPRTGDRVDVPSKTVVYFKPGRAMREMLSRFDLTDSNAPAAARPRRQPGARPVETPKERSAEA
ncbi:MAG: integration host factor subunit beta [Planctomycetes bacterium]|nr:integration host factor subunit beta [Planctomycetota bacterium]